METNNITIKGIPAVLWGRPSERLFIAVHGDQSDKSDHVIRILAEEAEQKGYRTLSFDLPEHGERKEQPELCKPQICVAELKGILTWVQEQKMAAQVSVFGCSLGAYFSILALNDEVISRALFLSPVVNMERIISNMMTWFSVSEERLRQEQEIQTPVKTLYWDYYRYVLEHPVRWNHPTAILYGRDDQLCEYDYVRHFAKQSGAKLTVCEKGEHFFHTEEQLDCFRNWLKSHILQT